MTLTFKLIIIVLFLAHTMFIAFILHVLDDSNKIITHLGSSAIWTVYLMFWGYLILFSTIKDKGLHLGESMYSAPLYPFLSSRGDSVYLELNCDTYHFRISEDSTIWKSKMWCYTHYLKEGEMPYYERIFIVADPWVLDILKPDHEYLQPRYVLAIPPGTLYEIPCNDEETDYTFYYPPY